MLHAMDGRWPECYITGMVGGHYHPVLHDMDGR